MKLFLSLLVLHFIYQSIAWNPDAGLVFGYQEKATLSATGQNGNSVPQFAADNNERTMWEGPWCSSCCNSLWIDLKSPQPVGWFYIRSGSSAEWVANIEVSVSVDNVTYTPAFSHPGGSWRGIVYPLWKDITARYIQARGCTRSSGGKVQIIELHVYDKNGHWGATKADDYVNPVNFNTLSGVNGIWQWGGAPNSPSVYAALVTNARSYENMAWDLNNPNQKLNFSHFPTNQGDGAGWLNWDEEYGQWKHGVNGGPGFVEIDASIQFTNDGAFAVSNWQNPYEDGYSYAHEYARHFGPTKGNGLVKFLECGNEPWNYPAEFYRTVLAGFAAGAKDGDSAMMVLPGAFQADTPEYPTQYEAYGGNYIGVRVNASVSKNIDVINTHAYSYINVTEGDWASVSYPEDPRSTMNAVRNVVRWTEANMPGKPVFLTEWGWDGASMFDTPPCFEGPWHKVCVSAEAKALYTMRGMLKIARDGLARGHIFYYANGDAFSPLYARSGLTSSKTTHFQKEPVYDALKRFLNILGNLNFMGVACESKDGYAYLVGSASGTPTYLVAWKPTDANDTTQSAIEFQKSSKWGVNPSVTDYVKLAGLSQTSVSASSVLKTGSNSYTVTVDKNLLVIPISAGSQNVQTTETDDEERRYHTILKQIKK